MATVTKTPPSNKNGLSHIVPTMIDDAAKAKIRTYPFRRNISVLEGSEGNIGVLTGQDGKLLVDSGFTRAKSRSLDALNRLSSDPVARLVNTHWHTDHSDGNAWIRDTRAKIAARINTKKHLSISTRNGSIALRFLVP